MADTQNLTLIPRARVAGVWAFIAWCCVWGAGCARHDAPLATSSSQTGGKPSKRRVAVAPVERACFSASIETVGVLAPIRSSSIAAGVSGIVEKVLFKEGDQVNAESVLIHVEQRRFRLTVETATARENKALTSLQLARDAHQRMVRLQSRNAISQEEFTQTLLGLRAAEADADLAAKTLALAREEQRQSQVRAPYVGQINQRLVAEGDYVKPDTVIATMADLSALRLTTHISESLAAQVKVGHKLFFQPQAFPDLEFSATIFYVSTVADSTTHLFECKALVDDTAPQLRPGFFTRVRIPTSSRPESFAVAEQAVRASENGFVVYVAVPHPTSQGMVAQRRTVRLGMRKPGIVEILAGLTEDDEVVVQGAEGLENGMALDVTTQESVARVDPRDEPLVRQYSSPPSDIAKKDNEDPSLPRASE